MIVCAIVCTFCFNEHGYKQTVVAGGLSAHVTTAVMEKATVLGWSQSAYVFNGVVNWHCCRTCRGFKVSFPHGAVPTWVLKGCITEKNWSLKQTVYQNLTILVMSALAMYSRTVLYL